MLPVRSIYAFPWDLAEHGIKSSLSELQNIGLNTVKIAGSYHAGKFLRPRSSSPVYFPEDGTIYFRHDPSRYGKIAPIPNSMVSDQDILGETVQNSELAVNVWLVLLHNTPLGSQHLDDCVVNVFGDPCIYNLCPSSPHAREYAKNLAADVSEKYSITGISLESPGFAPFIHGYHHEFNLVKPNKWLENLLGLCFCKNCEKKAAGDGIDIIGLRLQIKKWITDYLYCKVDYPEDMAESFWLADIATGSELMEFINWRCDVVTSLVAEIRSIVPKHVSLTVIPSVARPTANAWYEGSNLIDLHQTADILEICLYEPNWTRAAADLEDVQRRLGGPVGLHCIIRPSWPDLNSGRDVDAAVTAIVQSGVEGIGFYNWGFLRRHSLQYIYQALQKVLK